MDEGVVVALELPRVLRQAQPVLGVVPHALEAAVRGLGAARLAEAVEGVAGGHAVERHVIRAAGGAVDPALRDRRGEQLDALRGHGLHEAAGLVVVVQGILTDPWRMGHGEGFVEGRALAAERGGLCEGGLEQGVEGCLIERLRLQGGLRGELVEAGLGGVGGMGRGIEAEGVVQDAGDLTGGLGGGEGRRTVAEDPCLHNGLAHGRDVQDGLQAEVSEGRRGQHEAGREGEGRGVGGQAEPLDQRHVQHLARRIVEHQAVAAGGAGSGRVVERGAPVCDDHMGRAWEGVREHAAGEDGDGVVAGQGPVGVDGIEQGGEAGVEQGAVAGGGIVPVVGVGHGDAVERARASEAREHLGCIVDAVHAVGDVGGGQQGQRVAIGASREAEVEQLRLELGACGGVCRQGGAAGVEGGHPACDGPGAGVVAGGGGEAGLVGGGVGERGGREGGALHDGVHVVVEGAARLAHREDEAVLEGAVGPGAEPEAQGVLAGGLARSCRAAGGVGGEDGGFRAGGAVEVEQARAAGEPLGAAEAEEGVHHGLRLRQPGRGREEPGVPEVVGGVGAGGQEVVGQCEAVRGRGRELDVVQAARGVGLAVGVVAGLAVDLAAVGCVGGVEEVAADEGGVLADEGPVGRVVEPSAGGDVGDHGEVDALALGGADVAGAEGEGGVAGDGVPPGDDPRLGVAVEGHVGRAGRRDAVGRVDEGELPGEQGVVVGVAGAGPAVGGDGGHDHGGVGRHDTQGLLHAVGADLRGGEAEGELVGVEEGRAQRRGGLDLAAQDAPAGGGEGDGVAVRAGDPGLEGVGAAVADVAKDAVDGPGEVPVEGIDLAKALVEEGVVEGVDECTRAGEGPGLEVLGERRAAGGVGEGQDVGGRVAGEGGGDDALLLVLPREGDLAVGIDAHLLEIMAGHADIPAEHAVELGGGGIAVEEAGLMAGSELVVGADAALAGDPAGGVAHVRHLGEGEALRIGEEVAVQGGEGVGGGEVAGRAAGGVHGRGGRAEVEGGLGVGGGGPGAVEQVDVVQVGPEARRGVGARQGDGDGAEHAPPLVVVLGLGGDGGAVAVEVGEGLARPSRAIDVGQHLLELAVLGVGGGVLHVDIRLPAVALPDGPRHGCRPGARAGDAVIPGHGEEAADGPHAEVHGALAEGQAGAEGVAADVDAHGAGEGVGRAGRADVGPGPFDVVALGPGHEAPVQDLGGGVEADGGRAVDVHLPVPFGGGGQLQADVGRDVGAGGLDGVDAHVDGVRAGAIDPHGGVLVVGVAVGDGEGVGHGGEVLPGEADGIDNGVGPLVALDVAALVAVIDEAHLVLAAGGPVAGIGGLLGISGVLEDVELADGEGGFLDAEVVFVPAGQEAGRRQEQGQAGERDAQAGGGAGFHVGGRHGLFGEEAAGLLDGAQALEGLALHEVEVAGLVIQVDGGEVVVVEGGPQLVVGGVIDVAAHLALEGLDADVVEVGVHEDAAGLAAVQAQHDVLGAGRDAEVTLDLLPALDEVARGLEDIGLAEHRAAGRVEDELGAEAVGREGAGVAVAGLVGVVTAGPELQGVGPARAELEAVLREFRLALDAQ